MELLCPLCLLVIRGHGRRGGIEFFDQIVSQIIGAAGKKDDGRHVGALARDIQHQGVTAGFGVRIQDAANFFDDVIAALALLFPELGGADAVVFLYVLFGAAEFIFQPRNFWSAARAAWLCAAFLLLSRSSAETA